MFAIDLKKVKLQIENLASYNARLNQNMQELQNISERIWSKNDETSILLRKKIQAIAEEIQMEKKELDHLVSVLEQIVELYQTSEERLLELGNPMPRADTDFQNVSLHSLKKELDNMLDY